MKRWKIKIEGYLTEWAENIEEARTIAEDDMSFPKYAGHLRYEILYIEEEA